MSQQFRHGATTSDDGIMLSGGYVIDGTGASGRQADVRIVDGRIAEVESNLSTGSSNVIDVKGLVVSPGFIDLHAHSEGPLWRDPHHLPKVSQGVTLELLGQDGLGYAPVDSPGTLVALADRLVAWHGPIDRSDLTWTTLGDFMNRLEGRGLGLNVAFLAPHGTIRLGVMGDDAAEPNPSQLAAMQALTKSALADGAFGISTGLSYAPAAFATTDEMVSLGAVMSRWDLFVPHLRDYGSGAFDAYLEGMEVAARSGVRLHLTHALLNGEGNVGRADELLELVNHAATPTTLDVYPYDAGSTYLHVFLPRWLSEHPVATQLAMLEDEAIRERLAHELENYPSWAQVVLAGLVSPSLQRHAGASIAEVASERGTSPVEAYCDILIEDQMSSSCIHFNGNVDNMERLLSSPRVAVASDSLLTGTRPHPRGWGTFPRFLHRYSLSSDLLRLEDAVRRMTGLPASILGLPDRGVLRPGAIADICCFDPSTVRDNATFEDPRKLATGFRHVLVHGVPVILEGEPTDALPGRVARRATARAMSRPCSNST